MRLAVVLLISGALVPADVGAQRIRHDNMVVVGDTIRVRLARGRIEGIVRATGDTLRLRHAGTEQVIPRADVRELYVRRGTRAQMDHVFVTSAFLSVAGLFAGALLGAAVECAGSCNDDGAMAGFLGAMGGAGVGSVVGAVFGVRYAAARHRTPRWIRAIYPERSSTDR